MCFVRKCWWFLEIFSKKQDFKLAIDGKPKTLSAMTTVFFKSVKKQHMGTSKAI
jgi:hypothetical protein